jgi:hypothetical protein
MGYHRAAMTEHSDRIQEMARRLSNAKEYL